MKPEELHKALEALSLQVYPLEILVSLLTCTLRPPVRTNDAGRLWFSYESPDARHYCLLKAARAVSALNAALYLTAGGFPQEVAIQMRITSECVTEIDFIVVAGRRGPYSDQANQHIREFFADTDRSPGSKNRRQTLGLSKIREIVGQAFDETNIGNAAGIPEGMGSGQLLAIGFHGYSKYVHAGYPEIMDLYGDVPGHFHLRGMKGTPKDEENVEVLETFISNVDGALRLMVKAFQLENTIIKNDILARWLSFKMA